MFSKCRIRWIRLHYTIFVMNIGCLNPKSIIYTAYALLHLALFIRFHYQSMQFLCKVSGLWQVILFHLFKFTKPSGAFMKHN